MGFSPAGGKMTGASDVAVSNATSSDFLKFDASTQLWKNTDLTGYAALTTGGGSETVQSPAWAATLTLSLANANVFSVALTGNTTFAFTGATNSRACSFALYVRQDATGGRTVTWPTSVRWANATKPSSSTGASQLDIFVFESINGGTTWYGSLVGNNFA